MTNIICVKTGSKYNSSYVNRLLSMCKQNITVPFRLFCYTDDPVGVDPEVHIVPYVENNLHLAVYNKLFLFSRDFASHLDGSGRCVFFDLDMVIKSNIDELIQHKYDNLRVISSTWKPTMMQGRGSPMFDHPINSSCMAWLPHRNYHIWDRFSQSPQEYMQKYRFGMDSYLHYEHSIIGGLPERLFYSFLYGLNLKLTRIYKDPAKLKELRESIPIVLFNGPTTELDVQEFIDSSYTTFIEPFGAEFMRRCSDKYVSLNVINR